MDYSKIASGICERRGWNPDIVPDLADDIKHLLNSAQQPLTGSEGQPRKLPSFDNLWNDYMSNFPYPDAEYAQYELDDKDKAEGFYDYLISKLDNFG